MIVGPPGVGKTYLISQIVKRIVSNTSGSKILLSAQSHDALANLERALHKEIDEDLAILVRIEKDRRDNTLDQIDNQSSDYLSRLLKSEAYKDIPIGQQEYLKEVNEAGHHKDNAERVKALRDTNALVRRSANIVMATTNSYAVEEMISNGEQFDWVIVEEAARANACELSGPLILGNRRILVGDHHQLPPFSSTDDAKYFAPERAGVLLETARKHLSSFSFLPPEIDNALQYLEDSPSRLIDVMAMAARMSEPFRDAVEGDMQRQVTAPCSRMHTTLLREQSRMDPSIAELISNTFYEGKLITAPRVRERQNTIQSVPNFPSSPIVLLNLPALARTSRKRPYENSSPRPWTNECEANVMIEAIGRLKPSIDAESEPTIAVLSPYTAQVALLKEKISNTFDVKNNQLLGFRSVRGNDCFVETVDSFQGSEADVILVGLVRNNSSVGNYALGFLRDSRRMNVLLSRARQKLIIATSSEFLNDAVAGVDPDAINTNFDFLRRMTAEIERLSKVETEHGYMGSSIISISQDGSF